jgi:hypothetical protein
VTADTAEIAGQSTKRQAQAVFSVNTSGPTRATGPSTGNEYDNIRIRIRIEGVFRNRNCRSFDAGGREKVAVGGTSITTPISANHTRSQDYRAAPKNGAALSTIRTACAELTAKSYIRAISWASPVTSLIAIHCTGRRR